MKRLFAILVFLTFINGYTQSWNDVNNQGMAAYKEGDYDLAISYYEKALKMAVKEFGKLHNNYATSLNNLGMMCKIKSDFDNAEKYFIEALEVREKALGKNSKDYSISLNNLGSLYKVMGRYEESETYYLEALTIAESLYGKTSPSYATYVNNVAGLYRAMGKYKESESYYLEAAKILKSNYGDEHPDYGTCLNNLAILYKTMGDYIKAEPLYLKSLQIRKEKVGPNSYEYAISLNNLASFYQDMDQYDKAKEYYLLSIDILAGAIGTNDPAYANTINNLAMFYAENGNLNEAEMLMVQALEIRRKVLGESHPEYALSLNTVGQFYNTYTRNFETAEGYLLKSLEIRKKIFGEQSAEVAVALNSLSNLYENLGDFERAEPLMEQSMEINKKVLGEMHPTYATSLNNMADLYDMMGNYEEALKLYLKAADIRKMVFGNQSDEYASTLMNLSIVYGDIGEYKKAEELQLEALGIRKNIFGEQHPNYLSTLSNLIAGYMKAGWYDKAIKYVDRSVAGFCNSVMESSSFLSEMEFENYLLDKSIDMDAYLSFEWKAHTKFDEVSSTMLDLSLFMDGLQLRTSASMKTSIYNNGDSIMMSKYQDWVNYRYQISQQMSLPIAQRNEDLESWGTEANTIEKDLIRGSSVFTNVEHEQSRTWTDLRDQLANNEAAVEFITFRYYNGQHWTDSILYSAVLFRAKDTIPIYIPLFEEKQLIGLLNGDTVRTFANLLYTEAQVRNEQHDISYGDSLFKLTWKPLEPFLKDIAHLYYSPSGLLHHLSFDAIPIATTQLLSDKYQLHRSTTVRKISDKKEDQFQPSSIALFGGIQYDVDTNTLKQLAHDHSKINIQEQYSSSNESLADAGSRGGSWTYLPGAKKEVLLIDQLFRKNEISTYSYSDQFGTEELVKNLNAKNSPSILHFSTHGFFFPDPEIKADDLNRKNMDNESAFKYSDNPLFRSGLILAGANYVWKGGKSIEGVEDGILTAYEVSNLYLPNTKLVVMSACETGLGDIKGSEGVYGLQRAFKIAGVDYIIMTLWQVLDKETSDFMTLFYQNLLDKKNIPDAFKSTQDVMKNKYRDEPYKWAGFVLVR